MRRTRAVTRPARCEQVRGTSECVESIKEIEKPKNKNFQNFQIFTSYHTSECDFDCFHFAEKLFESRIDKILYFSRPRLPMGPKGAPVVIWRSPQASKNQPKTHQKMTPTCPYALPEHENCKFHRIQKLSLITRYRRSFSCSPSGFCMFWVPILSWGQVA